MYTVASVSDTSFERALLATAVVKARKFGARIKGAWVHCVKGTQAQRPGRIWDFLYEDFHTKVRANSAYHARALGWEEWVAREICKVRRQEHPIEWRLTYALSHESYGGHDHNDGSVTVTVKAASRTEAIKRGATKVKRSNPVHEAKLTNCVPTV